MTAHQAAWAKAAEDDRARTAARAAAQAAGGLPDWPRIAAAVVVAIAAITVWFVMAPEEPHEATRSPVTATERLRLLSVQQEEADARRDALLLTGLLGGALAMATSRRPARH